ncbi:uncharacterized protein CFAP92 [Pelobates fuscus]|uniref:uncharacterized protein CFAP92 n=1 Tax=Pelobates fuscus TaxID=191477 RepID=UPI002FE48171
MKGPPVIQLSHTEHASKGPISNEGFALSSGAPDSEIDVDFGTPHVTSLTPDHSEVSGYGTGGGSSDGDEAEFKNETNTKEQSPFEKCQKMSEKHDVIQQSGVASSVSDLHDSSHTITFTITIAFAIPPTTTKDDPTQDTKKNPKQQKKLIDSPRAQEYYHFEYHLLPEHTEPTKADVVLFGVVAKLYIEHETQLLKPWFDENGRLWLVWSHKIELCVTKNTIHKALMHQIQLKIWDTKDKVSPRARFDRPKAFRVSQYGQEDDSKVKLKITSQRKHFADGQPRPSFILHADRDAVVSPRNLSSQGLSSVTEQRYLSGTTPKLFSSAAYQKYQEQRLPVVHDDSADMTAGLRLKRESGETENINLEAALRKYRLNLKSPKGHKTDDVSSKSRRRSLGAVKHEKISSALSTKPEKKCLSLAMSLKPFLAGELCVTERLHDTSDKVLDGYITLVTDAPLLSEEQEREFNPLVIRILSATSLPTKPTPIHILQEKCQPVYCSYRFHDQPFYRTHCQEHGTHIYFKDINVILAGTFNPSKLQEYLNGPPLEIEVHDRDRKIKQHESTPSLYGSEPEDEKLSNVGLVASRYTLHNQFNKRMQDPYGIAKVRLSELVQGAKYLNICAPIENCEAPDPTRHSPNAINGKIRIMESVDDSQDSLLPVGHYLDSQSFLKVRVDIAVPLSVETNVSDSPYNRIIYIFNYNNRKFLHTIIKEITDINAKALNLDDNSLKKNQDVLYKVHLTSEQKNDTTLDVITGIHIMDGSFHLFVLEGLKDRGIKKLWESLPIRPLGTEDEKVDVRYNSQLSFCDRIYKDLDVLLSHIHLHDGLSSIMKQPTLYIRDLVPSASFHALSRLNFIYNSSKLRDVVQNDLLPSAEMVLVMRREFGIPVSLQDIFSESDKFFSNKVIKSQKRSKTSQTKQSMMCYSVDTYNLQYIKWKQECDQYTDYIKDNIEKIHHLSRPVSKATNKYIEVPDDSGVPHNYSCQTFNSFQCAQNILQQEMAKEPKQRFTYSREYHSATVSPLDLDKERKEIATVSKSKWKTCTGFIYPGFKSSIKSNAHPKQLDDARIDDLAKAWKENILHANILKPTLTRDRWSWEQRRSDFDLYLKYYDRFPLFVPGAVHLAGIKHQEEEKQARQVEYHKWLQNSKVENSKMEFHQSFPKTEMTSQGI